MYFIRSNDLLIRLLPSAFIGMLLLGTSDCDAQTAKAPPYHGTIFEFPDLIQVSDPTALQKLRFVERSEREMFDRRTDKFKSVSVFVFEASYRDCKPLEIDVNREFESEAAATKVAKFYATVFGRLPLMLRTEIDALHVQAGKQLFGGGRNVLIHTEQGEEYHRDGILEETLGHEAAHSLDAKHARHPDWLAAQKQDVRFISQYASEYPYREDIAESVIPYLAIRFHRDRINAKQFQVISETIPARLKYFDALNSVLFPQNAIKP